MHSRRRSSATSLREAYSPAALAAPPAAVLEHAGNQFLSSGALTAIGDADRSAMLAAGAPLRLPSRQGVGKPRRESIASISSLHSRTSSRFSQASYLSSIASTSEVPTFAKLPNEYDALLDAMVRDHNFPQRQAMPPPVVMPSSTLSGPVGDPTRAETLPTKPPAASGATSGDTGGTARCRAGDNSREIMSMYHADPLRRLTRSDVEELAARGIVALEKTLPPDIATETVPDLPLWRQGNIALYEPQAVVERDAIRFDKSFLKVTRKWWDAAVETRRGTGKQATASSDGPTEKENGEMSALLSRSFGGKHISKRAIACVTRVDRFTYARMLLLIARVLLPEASPAEARRVAEDDCAVDFDGATVIDLPRFHDALYQLADLWTLTTLPEDYVSFLQDLFDVVTMAAPGQGELKGEDGGGDDDSGLPVRPATPSGKLGTRESQQRRTAQHVPKQASRTAASSPRIQPQVEQRGIMSRTNKRKQRRRKTARRVLHSVSSFDEEPSLHKRAHFREKYRMQLKRGIASTQVTSTRPVLSENPWTDASSASSYGDGVRFSTLHDYRWGSGKGANMGRGHEWMPHGPDFSFSKHDDGGFLGGAFRAGAFTKVARWEDDGTTAQKSRERRPVNELPFFRDLFGRYRIDLLKPVIPCRPLATRATVYRNMLHNGRCDTAPSALAVRDRILNEREKGYELLRHLRLRERNITYPRGEGACAAHDKLLEGIGRAPQNARGSHGLPVRPGTNGSVHLSESARTISSSSARARVAKSSFVMRREQQRVYPPYATLIRSSSARAAAVRRVRAEQIAKRDASMARSQSSRSNASMTTPHSTPVIGVEPPFSDDVEVRARQSLNISARPSTASARILHNFTKQLRDEFGARPQRLRAERERRRIRYASAAPTRRG